MGLEIERKFLLQNDSWKKYPSTSQHIKQGYLSLDKDRTVRVRTTDDKGFLTVKGKTIGTTRLEFEYEIPLQEAEEMLKLSDQLIIEKTRYTLNYQNKTWEIDLFEGANTGLVVAEIELNNASEQIVLPSWIGEEVSHDRKYYNACLATQPFTAW